MQVGIGINEHVGALGIDICDGRHCLRPLQLGRVETRDAHSLVFCASVLGMMSCARDGESHVHVESPKNIETKMSASFLCV